MLKFDLNVSLVLKGVPLLESFERACALGFGAVEFWWSAGIEPDQVARRVRDAGLEVVLFNLDAGDMGAGDRGLLNDPARQPRLREHVPVALELAQKIGCKKLNALAGHWRPGVPRAEQLAWAADNLAWIAAQAKPAGVTILVEAVNNLENGDYLFPTAESVLDFLDQVDADNVAFQFDTYHLQRMQGDLTTRLRRHRDRIGHIQLADSPTRNEPGTGELNFPYLFRVIEEIGYTGHIGLEYKPARDVDQSLAWLPADRRGPMAASAVRLPGSSETAVGRA